MEWLSGPLTALIGKLDPVHLVLLCFYGWSEYKHWAKDREKREDSRRRIEVDEKQADAMQRQTDFMQKLIEAVRRP